jgi:asparagine synthase (glutamine-hydrolysing)
MCGIAGIVSANTADSVDLASIVRMCDAIVHRGPDDAGTFVKGNAGLGMRRLSIIDLAGGHQPIFNEDRSVWIVFNGEIYNFVELRADLISRGHIFSTNTDTEVIVHLYEEWGRDCVLKLRGMFAFAIYDERRRKLLLARDRLGKKPLHYAQVRDRLLFASEIKALLAIAPELADLDHQALLQYLYFGYILDPRTAFNPIHKLPAGHLLEFEAGQIHTQAYWDLPPSGTHPPMAEGDVLDELESRLTDCVRMRMISDVPLGALLSGGTDSSTVVGVMARCSSQPVETFSIGFQQSDFNETRYARLVAEKFSTHHHELFLEPDVVATLEQLTAHMEEPFGDSTLLPMYYLCQLARQNVTVALSGDGGDELFGGYDRYRIQLRRNFLERVPKRLRRWYRERVFPRLPNGTYGKRLSYSLSLDWAERYVDEMSLIPVVEREVPLLTREFRQHCALTQDPQEPMLMLLNEEPGRDRLSRLLYLDTKTYLAADILTYVDRMSMATSLEVRVPLLDHVLVEWVTALPSHWKIHGDQQKYLLRKFAERIGVPREVLYRPKKGFAMPLLHWIRSDLKELILNLLLDSRTLQRGYFDRRGIELILNNHFSGRRNESGTIWRLLIFELWHRNFLESLRHSPVSTALPSSPARTIATGN